jgi:ergothioneine biosynthesis protein EgtB
VMAGPPAGAASGTRGAEAVTLLRKAWERTDGLFGLLRDDALLAQPIPLRQPFLFYLGHLPAFAWNHLGRRLLGQGSFRGSFDVLFERGIDPLGVDAYRPTAVWPEVHTVLAYRDEVRRRVADLLGDPGFPEGSGGPVALMVLEHEQMHQETLLYMVQQLEHASKRRPADLPPLPQGRGVAGGRVLVPAGEAVLGVERGAIPFGWDNEFPEHRAFVPAFQMDRTPVRNAAFLDFVEAGGYEDPRLWTEDGWAWRERQGVRHPRCWRPTKDGWLCRALFEDVTLGAVSSWPVYVSWAEAAAYAAWQGGRLPTEAEFQRAAFGSLDGPRRWPWGDDPPEARHGNFGYRHLSPTPVGSFPDGASAWGGLDLLGNGWEWTSTPFGPLPGFERMPGYPGYSADFFDGRHYVVLGGSWATDARLLRRSFRNWFQPHYPYVFATFRCVRDD